MSQNKQPSVSWRTPFLDLEYEIAQKVGHYVVTCEEYAYSDDHGHLFEEISKGYHLPIKLITNDGNEISWWTNGVNHNPDGPAINFRYGDRKIDIIYKTPDGTIHNPGGPAWIHRDENIYEEIWTNHLGRKHREEGPAYTHITYKRDGREIVPFFPDLKGTYGMEFFRPDETFEQVHEELYEWVEHGATTKRMTQKLTLSQKFLVADDDQNLDFEERSHIESITWEFFEPVQRTEESDPLLHRVNGPAMIVFRDIFMVNRGGQTKIIHQHRPDYRWYVGGEPLAGVEKFLKQARIDLKTNDPEKSFFRSAQDHMIFMSRINDLKTSIRFA